MPSTSCGHAFNNSITIGSVGTFPLSQDDYRAIIGSEGAKSLSIKMGSFLENLNTYRVEYDISLYHIERSVYEDIKEFAKNDILNYYLQIYQGTVDLDLGGESYTGCVIKKIDLPGISAIMPGTPEVEYIEQVSLKILAPEYRLI
jgi:hypothetical protein